MGDDSEDSDNIVDNILNSESDGEDNSYSHLDISQEKDVSEPQNNHRNDEEIDTSSSSLGSTTTLRKRPFIVNESEENKPTTIQNEDDKIFKGRKSENFNRKEKKKRSNDMTTNETNEKNNNDISNSSLRIEGFLRPFTLTQAREMIEEKGEGPLIEGSGGFWMDSIKTHAIVTFQNHTHAKKAYQNIQSLIWPISVGRALQVSYSSKKASDMSGGTNQRRIISTATSTATPTATPASVRKELEMKLRQNYLKNEKGSIKMTNNKKTKSDNEKDNNNNNNSLNMKYDDKTQIEQQSGKSVVIRRGRGILHTLRPSHLTMNDVFLKTETKPHIYWLPVDEATIERRKKLLEEKKQQKQSNKN